MENNNESENEYEEDDSLNGYQFSSDTKLNWYGFVIFPLALFAFIYAIELVPNLFGYSFGRDGYIKINSPDEFWAQQLRNLYGAAAIGIIGILSWIGIKWEEARDRKNGF